MGGLRRVTRGCGAGGRLSVCGAVDGGGGIEGVCCLPGLHFQLTSQQLL